MIDVLELILPLYCFGNALFQQLIFYASGDTDRVSYLSYFGVLLGFVHMFLPMDKVNQYLFPVKK